MVCDSELKFQAIFDNLVEPIYIVDPETHEILYVNRILENLIQEKIIGKKCYKIFQNLDTLYPFCTNKILYGDPPVSLYIWEHYNKKQKIGYRCIDQ